MAAWLPQPVVFESSRDFDCEGFNPNQCEYYKERWHNWYIADRVFALPTVALFSCTVAVFTAASLSTQTLAVFCRPVSLIWPRGVAAARYLTYRGFRIEAVGWNSAPIGVLLLGAMGSIYFLCMDLAPYPYYWPGADTVWGNSPPLGTRSGWLALACMPFIFATASKTNWITLVTGVTHEKLQVFHRWIAYAFLLLALMHTFPFIIWHIRNHDMVYQFTVSDIFEYWTGIVALVFQAWLTFASWGPIRSSGYEFFKATHFLSAVVFVVVFFWHCSGTLTSWDYFVATAAVYVPCWTYPWLRTLFEYGAGQKARVFIEENGFMRITIPGNFRWHPGQHCFLRFRSFGIHALSSHPFTICSLPYNTSAKPSELVFYVRHRGGFTARLYSWSMMRPSVQLPVLVDGPYGGIDNTKYFASDRLVVVAGGSGAGWTLPLVEQFLRYHHLSAALKSSADKDQQDDQASQDPLVQRVPQGPRNLRVLLATRDAATRTWFYTAIENLLSEYESPVTASGLSIEVYLTGEAKLTVQAPAKSASVIERSCSSSSGEELMEKHGSARRKLDTDNAPLEARGRPDLPLIVRQEATVVASTGEAVGIFVCGPLSMQNDVRNAVAKENLNILKSPRSGGIYLHLEHFSWA